VGFTTAREESAGVSATRGGGVCHSAWDDPTVMVTIREIHT
jgi:hypothetical protein